MKKIITYFIVFFCSFISATNTFATSYQVFRNISFANPAMLNKIKQGELIFGGTTIFNTIDFSGTAAGVRGSTSSHTTYEVPYGRIAMRATPQIVFGVDITQPFITDIEYPRNSFVRFFATDTVIRDTNISPKVSYQVNKQLAVGVGLDINNFYNGELNFVVPPLGLLSNRASSWAYGWDAGLFYILRPSTFLSFNYYSLIVQHTRGKSDWGGVIINNSLAADIKLPATYIGSVIQMLSPFWVVSGTLRYTLWNTFHNTVLTNTALSPTGRTIVIPANFFNNISAEIATQYQINPKWAVFGLFDYEPNVQPTSTRNIGLPTYTRYYPGIGAEYALTKGLKARVAYAHVFSQPPINLRVARGPTVIALRGNARLNADAVDLSITYSI